MSASGPSGPLVVGLSTVDRDLNQYKIVAPNDKGTTILYNFLHY